MTFLGFDNHTLIGGESGSGLESLPVMRINPARSEPDGRIAKRVNQLTKAGFGAVWFQLRPVFL